MNFGIHDTECLLQSYDKATAGFVSLNEAASGSATLRMITSGVTGDWAPPIETMSALSTKAKTSTRRGTTSWTSSMMWPLY